MKRKNETPSDSNVSKKIKTCYLTPVEKGFDAKIFMLEVLEDNEKLEQFHNWITYIFSTQQIITMRETLNNLPEYKKTIYHARISSLRACLYLLIPYPKLKNIVSGLACLDEAVRLKEPMALCNAGNFYMKGSDYTNYTKNPEKAIALFEEAAGIHPYCKSFLGHIYLNGNQHIPKDYAKAKQYYESGVEQGSVACKVGLAYMYQYGIKVEKDYTKAFNLYLQAAEMGHTYALCSVGIFYKNGLGVQKNVIKAKAYLILAGKQFDKIAMLNLGRIYMEAQDYPKAFDWFYQASQSGCLDSLWHVAKAYNQGLGVLLDADKGLVCLEKGAEKEHLPCMMSAALIHLNADFKKGIPETGWSYMDKAIEKQFGPAIYWKGEAFFFGAKELGIGKNYVQARIWFEKAATVGHGAAFFMLGYINHKGLGVPVNIMQALKYYRMAKHHDIELVSSINNTDKSLGQTDHIFLENEPVEPTILLQFMEKFPINQPPQEGVNALLIAQLKEAGCYDVLKKASVQVPLFFTQQTVIWNKFCDFKLEKAYKGSEEYVLWSCLRTSNRHQLFKNILEWFPDVLAEPTRQLFLRKLRFADSDEYDTDLEETVIDIDKKVARNLSMNRFVFFSLGMRDRMLPEVTMQILEKARDIHLMPW